MWPRKTEMKMKNKKKTFSHFIHVLAAGAFVSASEHRPHTNTARERSYKVNNIVGIFTAILQSLVGYHSIRNYFMYENDMYRRQYTRKYKMLLNVHAIWAAAVRARWKIHFLLLLFEREEGEKKKKKNMNCVSRIE